MADRDNFELPDLVMDDSDADDLLDDLDALETSAVPKRKWTIEDDVPGEAEGMAEELVDLASKVPGGPPMSKHILVNLLEDFKSAHKKKIRKGKFCGSERKREDFVKRLGEFLVIKLQTSKKMDRKTGQPVLGKKGKPVYMTIGSLYTLGHRLKHLLQIAPLPRFDGAERAEAEKEIDKIIETCVQVYKLAPSDRKYSTLYAVDVNRLIEKCYEFAEGKYDIAVQFHAMILTFFYTGGRCGSILRTAHYPDEFLRWHQVAFVSFKDDMGEHRGFGTHIRLDSFKGHHLKQDLHIKYKIPPVCDPRWINLDMGTALIAHSFRAEYFGDRSVDDLFDSTGFFGVEPEFEELPVFAARSSRMSLNRGKAMSDDSANPQLQDMMLKAGMAFGTSGSDTLRSLRRGFATTVPDKDIGRFFMGHDANSTMLERFYDQSKKGVSLTDAMLGVGAGEEMITDPLSVLRVEASYPKITLQSALEVCPEYRHLAAKKHLLKDCFRTGSLAWKKVSPFLELAKKRPLRYEDLPTYISKYTSDLRTVVDMVTKDAQIDRLRQRQIARNMLDYKTIKARREELERPSELALELQKRLLAQEQAMLERDEEPDVEWDGDLEVPGVDDETDEVIVDVNVDEEEEGAEDEQGLGQDEVAEHEQGQGDEALEGESESDGARGPGASTPTAPAKGKGRAQDAGSSEHQAEQRDPDAAQSDATKEWVEAVAGAHSDDPVEDGGTTASAASPEIDVVETKKTMLRTLVDLVDVADAGPQPCWDCAVDPFASAEEKAKLYKPGFFLSRHQAGRHSAFSGAWAMMHSGQVSNSEQGTPSALLMIVDRWQCPVGKLEHVDCSFAVDPVTIGDRRLKAHVLDKHKRHIKPEYYEALHPDSLHIAKKARNEAYARFANGNEPEVRVWQVNTDPIELADPAFLPVPVEVSHELKHIPASLIGEDGFLIL